MARVKIVKTPGAPAVTVDDGKGSKFFKDTLQYPNLIFNASTIGIINSNHLGTNDEQISSSLNPVDRENANIEAEKGEMLIKPNLDGFYKIKGKPHSDGGTPLAVPEGSFIFSNAKSLAFTNKDKELFQFKKGGDVKRNNTPAKVAEREVDPKEYNRLVAILSDDKSDEISKNSAALMLQKYQEKLGKVALLQEVKKKLKDGLPSFATLPSGPDEDSTRDIAETQYAKHGGFVEYPDGGITGYKGDKQTKKNASQYSDQQWKQFAHDIGFNGGDNRAFQTFLFNYNWDGYQGRPNLIDPIIESHGIKGDPYEPPSRKSMLNWLDGRLGYRWDPVYDAFYKWKNNQQDNTPQDYGNGTAEDYSGPLPEIELPEVTINSKAKKANTTQSPLPQRGWEGFHFDPNAAELFSIAAPGLQAIMSPTYYDMLSQRYTPNVRLDRLNNNQERSDIKEMSTLGTQEAFGAMPQFSNIAESMAASIRANSIKNLRQSDAGIQNANTQIANQESQINAQQKAADNDFNIQNIHQTYNNNVLARQRRNEQLANGFAQMTNNALAVRRNLDTLGYMATATALPSLTTMKDSNGNPIVFTDPKTGEKYTQLGVPLGFNENRIPTFDPRFGGLDSFLTSQYAQQGTSSDLAVMATKELKDAYMSKDAKRIFAASQAYDKIFGSSSKGNSAAQNALTQLMQRFSQ